MSDLKVLFAGPVVEIDGVKFHHHLHGGGLVAETVQVDDTVYVGSQSRVEGTAVVKGMCGINQGSIVGGQARIEGEVLVTKQSVIRGNVHLSGRVSVFDKLLEHDEEFSSPDEILSIGLQPSTF